MSGADLPFSQSCENNKRPILERLSALFAETRHVLEIAGGSGQHAEFFARELPQLRWQSSDIPGNRATLNLRLDAAGLPNLPPALTLDVNQAAWLRGSWVRDLSAQRDSSGSEQAKNFMEQAALNAHATREAREAGDFDALFSANSLHIMSAGSVTNFFLGAGKLLKQDALLVVYGPFNYDGQFTAPSNAQFDARLKEQNAESGIRDFESVSSIADIAGFDLEQDNEMPANNRLLVWRRR